MVYLLSVAVSHSDAVQNVGISLKVKRTKPLILDIVGINIINGLIKIIYKGIVISPIVNQLVNILSVYCAVFILKNIGMSIIVTHAVFGNIKYLVTFEGIVYRLKHPGVRNIVSHLILKMSIFRNLNIHVKVLG